MPSLHDVADEVTPRTAESDERAPEHDDLAALLRAATPELDGAASTSAERVRARLFGGKP